MIKYTGDRFVDKVVLITGASGGVGEKLVNAFLQEGAKVCAVYNRHKPTFDHRVFLNQADLTDTEQASKAVDRCRAWLGRIDVVVNGVGITANNFIEAMSLDEWQRVITANLAPAFNITKFVIPAMKERKDGNIINISSIVGVIGAVGCSNYAASKAGLVGFTRATARETCKFGIFVNTLVLGYCEVGMGLRFNEKIRQKIIDVIPVGHFGSPDEIVKAVFFLAETKYMTGSELRLSGGM